MNRGLSASMTEPTALPRAGWRSDRRWLALIPAAIISLVVFLVPVGEVAMWSVRNEQGWTLSHFSAALGDGPQRLILLSTLKLSMVVALASVALGYPVAYFLVHRPPRQQRMLLLLILTPLWVSVLIRTYSWIIVLGREGLFNSFLVSTGFAAEPLKLLYTRGAVYAAMVQVLMPVAILTMFSAMASISPSLKNAARILGASPARAFYHVFLPLSAAGALSAGVLTFVLALGFFITPALVGGPKDAMIANVIASHINETLDWGGASALGMTLLASALLIVGVSSSLLKRFTFAPAEGGTR